MAASDDGGRPALDWWAFCVIPLAVLAFQLATCAGYGYFRDELYYLANGRHLGWGYVEHPPLIGLVAAFVERVLGTSLFAVRLLPAIAHAATAALAAAIAREMGGRGQAQILAAAAVVASPIMLGLFSRFTMNAFDLVFWAALSWIVVRYLRTGDERLWLSFGVVAGIGLENKISVLFLGFGVACGLLLAGPRAAFRRPWIWVGGAIALAAFLPHIAWQAANGWPTLEFIRNATSEKNVALSPIAFLGAQALNTLPALPVWLAGLAFLVVARPARRFRAAGWAFLAVLAVMLATNSKPYYLAPAFTLLFAAGGVAFERLGAGAVSRLARAAVVAWLVANGAIAAPLAKPILSEDALVAYASRLGVQPPAEERQAQGRLPQTFSDMHGWPELAAAIGRVHQSLPPADRARACVYVQNYGEAGAVDLFGPRHGLPPAISGHNSYFLWGPGGCSGEVVIGLGGSEEDHRRDFASCERAGTFECQDCMPYENGRPIWICRGSKAPIGTLWPKLKHYI
jgi:hypothetical protein